MTHSPSELASRFYAPLQLESGATPCHRMLDYGQPRQERSVTKLLEEAFAVAARLTPADQDALAAAILAEVQAEPRWQASLGRSADGLARLAREAVEEYRTDRTEPLKPDTL